MTAALFAHVAQRGRGFQAAIIDANGVCLDRHESGDLTEIRLWLARHYPAAEIAWANPACAIRPPGAPGAPNNRQEAATPLAGNDNAEAMP